MVLPSRVSLTPGALLSRGGRPRKDANLGNIPRGTSVTQCSAASPGAAPSVP